MDFIDLYVNQGMSLSEVSATTGIAKSTIRFRLSKLALLRSNNDGLIIAGKKGKLSANKGIKRNITPEWKAKIAATKARLILENSDKIILKNNGYYEYARGINKGRRVHRVLMEEHLGRKLNRNEVVHHIDHNKLNNDISNLELMDLNEHLKLHAHQNILKRKRLANGRLK